MKVRKFLTIIVGVLFLLTMVPLAGHADVPESINYQGLLTGSDGNPVLDGDYEMSFAIYDAPTDGTSLWSESQTVTVTNGIYNVILGQPGNLLDPDIFEGELYLGVMVGGDSEMEPRQLLTSSPFAMKAAKADDADTLDDMDSLDFALSSHGHPWEEISDRPSGLDDGDDVGITSETDPTVLASVKDGVSWGELSSVPAGFADDVDNEGLTTETDPTVLSSVKDGVSWNEVTSKPSGFADGVDNEGVTTLSDYGRPGVTLFLYEGSSTM